MPTLAKSLRRLLTATGLFLTPFAAAQTTFTWNSGDILLVLNPSTVILGDTLNIETSGDHDLVAKTLTNNGTINWNAGYIRGGNTSVILNAAGATFNDLNASGYTVQNPFGGTFVFTNNGSYVRNTTGTTYFDIPFDNNGTVNLAQGAIQYRAGGTLASTGTITAAAGTTVTFTNGYTIQSGSSLAGAGTFQLTGGTMTLDGNIAVGSFAQSGGVLAGTQTISSGTFNWNAGNWNTGAAATTTIGATATLNIATGADHDFTNRAIINQGTVNWSSGYIRGGNGSAFTNAVGATFNDLNASSYTVQNPFGGSFTFTNLGTYVRNAAGTTYFDVPFDNSGTVSLLAGTIQYRAGGTLASTGTISAASGTSVVFTNGYTLDSGSTLTGAGSYQLTGGTLTLNGTVAVGTFTQSGGALAGTNTINGIFNWDAGNWNGATTTIGAAGTLNIGTGADHDFNSRTITNTGTVNWSSGYIRGGSGSTFTNAAGATFNDLNSSSYVIQNPFGGAFTFVNNGSYIRNTTGITYVDVPFDNNGTVSLQQGAMQLRAGGTMTSSGSISAASGTTVTFTNGYSIQSGSSLTGAGAYQLTGGTMTLDGTIAVGSFTQSGGVLAGTQTISSGTFNWNAGNWNTGAAATTTIGASAILNIATGADHDFNSRTITNTGTVNWSSGYIRGGSGSTFTNAAGATFNDLNSSSYVIQNPFGGAFTFTNNGSYIRNTTGTTYVDVPFANNGTVSLQQGAMQFRAGGTMTSTGSISAASGTTVTFTNGYSIDSGSSLTGAGAYQLTGGTMTLDGTIAVGSFAQSGGVLAGTQTISSGTFTWNSGNWNTGAAASTTIGASATLNIATGADHDFNSRAIINQGTVNWSSGYIRGGSGSTFTNAVGATFNDLNSSSYVIQNPFGGAFSFDNDGTYRRAVSGTTYIDVPFDNAGTISLRQGDLQLRSTATLQSTSELHFDLAGTVAATDYGLMTISAGLALSGTLELSFAGGFESTVNSSQTFTVLNAGTLSGSFTNVTNGNRLFTTDGFGSFQVNYGAGSSFGVNSVVLSNFSAVPEPSTWILLCLGAPLLRFVTRRRRT